MNVYNFIDNSKKLEITQMSFKGKCLNSLVYAQHEILLSDNKARTINTQNNLDEAPENYAE